jgi:hypothetical protein
MRQVGGADTGALERVGTDLAGVGPLGEVLERYRAVADVALNDGDLFNALQVVAREACELLGVGRCSLFLRDAEIGLKRFRGYAAYALVDREAVPRMVCGVEADRMTPEILQTGKPLLVRDAPNDGRPVRSAMLRHNVRDILGVPMMTSQDVVGLLFLDQPGESRRFSEAEQSSIAIFANLCAPTIEQLRRIAGVETAMGTLKRDVATLRRVQAIDARFRQLERSGGAAREVAELVTALTEKPCVFCTKDYEMLAQQTPLAAPKARFPIDPLVVGDPLVVAELGQLPPASAGVLGPYPQHDVRHRSLIGPVTVADARWGYFALLETGRRFTTADKFVVERAAQYLGAELRRGSRVFGAVSSRPAETAGLNGAEITQGVSGRGASGDVPRLVCLLQRRDGKPWDPGDVLIFEEAFDRAAGSVKTIGLRDGPRGIALITEQGAGGNQDAFVDSTRRALQIILRSEQGSGVAAVVSAVCRRSDDLARAHVECRQLMHCVLELCPPDSPPLAARDLGVGRLLLGMSDAFAMDRFVAAALGDLLVNGVRHAELLTTLHVFLESGRSPRNAGSLLHVHENTVRYRLTKVRELTGLDASADLNDQLTAQVALLVLRLQGRLPGVDFFGGLIRSPRPPDPGLTEVGHDLALGV